MSALNLEYSLLHHRTHGYADITTKAKYVASAYELIPVILADQAPIHLDIISNTLFGIVSLKKILIQGNDLSNCE